MSSRSSGPNFQLTAKGICVRMSVCVCMCVWICFWPALQIHSRYPVNSLSICCCLRSFRNSCLFSTRSLSLANSLQTPQRNTHRNAQWISQASTKLKGIKQAHFQQVRQSPCPVTLYNSWTSNSKVVSCLDNKLVPVDGLHGMRHSFVPSLNNDLSDAQSHDVESDSSHEPNDFRLDLICNDCGLLTWNHSISSPMPKIFIKVFLIFLTIDHTHCTRTMIWNWKRWQRVKEPCRLTR